MLIGFASRGRVHRRVVIGVRGSWEMMGILTMRARGVPRVVISGVMGRIRPWVVGVGR